MQYPDEVDTIVQHYLKVLKMKLQKNEFPFNDSQILAYYDMYLNLK